MKAFKTRYNYLVFCLILLGFILFACIAITLLFYGKTLFTIISENEKHKVAIYIGLSMVPIGVIWTLFFWGKILINYRYILTFTEDKLIKEDAIFSTTTIYELTEIEGYYEFYYLGEKLMKSVAFQLKDGSQIKIVNYLTKNFNNLSGILRARNIKKIKQ